MALDLLFPRFDELVRTPEDVHRLNEAILQLAVQGKLVAQDPNDEPTSELLKRIEATRQQLVQAKQVDRTRNSSSVQSSEHPFPLPRGWSATRLSALVSKLGAGSTPLGGKAVYENEGVKFIRSQNVWNDGLRLDDVARIPGNIHERMSGTTVMASDILLNITGASIGRSAVVPNDFDVANVSQHVAIVRMVEPDLRWFVHLYMISSHFQRMIMSVEVGISREGLSMSRLQDFVIPIPPLAEQQRIVAKVDELFAQTRALEARLRQAQADVVTANRAALHRLHSAQDDEQFQTAWRTIRDHFDVLYDDPRTVAELRQAILDLAVRGKLVAQDPNDEPAEELLRNIGGARSKENGKKKPLKSTRVSIRSDTPYDVPSSWEWAQFFEVANIATNSTDPGLYPDLPHIAPDNIEKFTGRLLAYRTVAEDGVSSVNHRFFSGQILYSKIRPNLSKAVLIDFEGLCSADMYPIESLIDARYLHLYILSSTFLSKVTRNDTRVAMPKVNQEALSQVPIAVPPLAEQQRIVAKVDQLMRLCDELEAGLAQTESQRQKLAAAVLA